jgi:protein gp37
VSPGCRFCYAAQIAGTQQTVHRIPLHSRVVDWVHGRPVFNTKLTVLPAGHGTWTWPLEWPGAEHPRLGAGMPSLIFVGDMADLFHENRPTADINRVVSIVAASRHIGLLLTKRADVMAAYFAERMPTYSDKTRQRWQQRLWLGVSTERQKELDARWPHLRGLAADGWTCFVNIAPMLGPVVLPPDLLAFGARMWVIVSGEQRGIGGQPRHMDLAWARSIRDQCQEAGVAYFFKQTAGKKPIPADLLIREFPAWPLNASGGKHDD